MTDLQRFKELFDEMEIEYTEGKTEEYEKSRRRERLYLYLEVDRQKGKISGYFGFYVRIIFDSTGMFETFGIYECREAKHD